MLHVERVEASALLGCKTAWADLCTRALEPNIFMEPAFALPLFQNIGNMKRTSVLLVWEENGPASFGRLLGLLPIERRGSALVDGIAHGVAHEQTSCGTPLIDRDFARQTIDALMGWLGAYASGVDALVFADVADGGPFHAELRRFCAASTRKLISLGTHTRAVLPRSRSEDEAVLCFASSKRRKERARQFRRLSEIGPRRYVSARTPPDVAAALERFLALEHQGWKGARGTALLADASLATFVRTMARQMATEGKCRVDSIDINGCPVAMGIVLTSADRAYFWKTAFDERYASLSPGVQFAIELTRAQLADPTIARTDSCAIANHPMIDKLWLDRVTVTDLMLAVAPGATWQFTRSLGIERLRRATRRGAKSLWLGLHRIVRR